MKTFFKRISHILKGFQLKQLLTALLVGVVLIAISATEATAATADLSPDVKTDLNRITEQGETGRPRTTGQWQAENEALQGQPLKQLERIGEETADAVGEMAEIYPQNAKALTPGVDNGRLPRDD